MTIWMKNLGLSLKLGAATDLLLEKTFNPLMVSDRQGLWEDILQHHSYLAMRCESRLKGRL
jgi:hypothetical protein